MSLCAPTCFTILPILPFCQFYHFVDVVSFTIFHSHQFTALPVLTFYHFGRAPTNFTIFTIFTNLPSIDSLVILVSLVSLFVLVMLVIPATKPTLVALGRIVGTAILAVLHSRADLVSLCPHVVIVIRSVLISLICSGLGLGVAWP